MNYIAEGAKLGVVVGAAAVLWWSRRFKLFWRLFGQPKGREK